MVFRSWVAVNGLEITRVHGRTTIFLSKIIINLNLDISRVAFREVYEWVCLSDARYWLFRLPKSYEKQNHSCTIYFKCWYLNFSHASASFLMFCKQSAAASWTVSSSDPISLSKWITTPLWCIVTQFQGSLLNWSRAGKEAGTVKFLLKMHIA